MKVFEKSLSVEGDPKQLKLIAEAVYEYHINRGIDMPKVVGDLCFNINSTYQEFNHLDPDNWDFTQEDKDELGL